LGAFWGPLPRLFAIAEKSGRAQLHKREKKAKKGHSELTRPSEYLAASAAAFLETGGVENARRFSRFFALQRISGFVSPSRRTLRRLGGGRISAGALCRLCG